MTFSTFQKNCGIWKENNEASFKTMEKREYQKEASEVLQNDEFRLVVLYGESQTGKSYLLSALANKYLYGYWWEHNLDKLNATAEDIKEAKKRAYYTTFFDIEIDLRMAQTKGTIRELFHELINAERLIVDEIGRGKWSDFTATFFQNVLLRRYGEKRYTYLATNLDGKEFMDLFDLAINERMRKGKMLNLKA